MPRIDSHQHFWKFNEEKHSWINESMSVLRRDFLPADLKKHLDEANIDGCVAVQADQSLEETDFLLNLAEKYLFIKGVVGWLDIKHADFGSQLEQYTTHDLLKGLRHIVQDEADHFLQREDFCEGISLLKNYNLTYDILIYEHQISSAVTFAGQFPDQTFVLDHIAKPQINNGKSSRWEQGIKELGQHPKMYCKLSGLVTEADWNRWKPDHFKPYLDVVFEAFGPERLMFGSDWPVCTLAAGYSEVLSIIEQYITQFSKEEQQMIMGGNAKDFYNL